MLHEESSEVISSGEEFIDDPETKALFEKLDIRPGTRGEFLYKAIVKNSVEFVLYVLARLLYPEHHYLTVLNNEDKFVDLRRLLENNCLLFEAVLKSFFIGLGGIGDKVIAEACKDSLEELESDSRNEKN